MHAYRGISLVVFMSFSPGSYITLVYLTLPSCCWETFQLTALTDIVEQFQKRSPEQPSQGQKDQPRGLSHEREHGQEQHQRSHEVIPRKLFQAWCRIVVIDGSVMTN